MFFTLLVAFLAIVAYQLFEYVLRISNVAEPLNDGESASDIHVPNYLPKSHNKKDIPIPKEVCDVMDKALKASDLYDISEASERLLSNDDKLDVPYGWGWDNNNILHIHCNTFFPGGNINMIKFWFKNMCNGKGKYHWYKWWHPNDHIKAWYDESEIHPNNDSTNNYINHNKYVYEYLGKETGVPMDFLLISFKNPLNFNSGFNKANNCSNKNKEIICGDVGVMNFQCYVAKMIHYCYNLDDKSGFLMKSRFWIGKAKVFDSVPYPFRFFLEMFYKIKFLRFFVYRKVLIPSDHGKRNLIHCAREMNTLAAFLPQLYKEYHKNNNE